MVIAQIRKNENLRCIWLIDFLSQVYRLALVSARNMLVTLGPNFSSISCQNREKFEPLLLACKTMLCVCVGGGGGRGGCRYFFICD